MKARWQDWFTLIFGSWLFVSPWLLQYITARPYMDQTYASWNSIIFGGIIVGLTAKALYSPKRKNWEEWVNLFLGLWLLVSPLVLGFYTQALATGNMVVVGLVVVALSGTVLKKQYSAPAAYR